MKGKNLKNNSINKGELIIEADYKNNEKQSFMHKKKHINNAFFGLIMGGLALGLCFIALFFVNLNNLETISGLLFLIIMLFLFMLFNLIILKKFSLSKNEVYENGLSSSTHSYFEYRAGKTFHYYKDITMIGWGYGIDNFLRKDSFRFLVIYKNNSNRHSTIFTDLYKVNDFFDQLIIILKQKCPNVPWVQVDWKSLPLPK
jgi:hypothetical protein